MHVLDDVNEDDDENLEDADGGGGVFGFSGQPCLTFRFQPR